MTPSTETSKYDTKIREFFFVIQIQNFFLIYFY